MLFIWVPNLTSLGERPAMGRIRVQYLGRAFQHRLSLPFRRSRYAHGSGHYHMSTKIDKLPRA